MSDAPYNPLDKTHLGQSVAGALLDSPIAALPPSAPFIGAGIYALYYAGDFESYRKIAARNLNEQWAAPIYVGKAVPPGARKGGYGLGEAPGQALYRRLCEHAESIKQASNLSLEHFSCRYLAVDDIWIPLGESLLISMFSPLWNMTLDGFGNHDPGAGRYNQRRSLWDELHPGRLWATRLQPAARTTETILTIIEQHLSKHAE